MTPDATAALHRSWRQLEPLADLFALTLYRRLFERAPYLRGLFHTDIETQGRRVFEAIGQALRHWDHPPQFGPMLEALGRRHRYAGVRKTHFRELEAALFLTLEDLLGSPLDATVRAAWTTFYDAVSAGMMRGLESVAEGADGCDTTRFFREPS